LESQFHFLEQAVFIHKTFLLKSTVYPCRDTHRNYLIREILDYNRARADDCAGANADALEYDGPKAQMRRGSQARCSTHSGIWCQMSIIADFYIVFDYGTCVYDDPSANLCSWINYCPSHDHRSWAKRRGSGHCRSRMNWSEDLDSPARTTLHEQLPGAVFSDPESNGNT
jgi:hypothetical protein